VTATPPPADPRERIAQALRDEAHVCEDACQPDFDCAEYEPIEAATVHTNGVVEEVRGAVEALADVAAGAVLAELAARDAENARLRAALAQVEALLPANPAEDINQSWIPPRYVRAALALPRTPTS
jgi:hypothetical protein